MLGIEEPCNPKTMPQIESMMKKKEKYDQIKRSFIEEDEEFDADDADTAGPSKKLCSCV